MTKPRKDTTRRKRVDYAVASSKYGFELTFRTQQHARNFIKRKLHEDPGVGKLYISKRHRRGVLILDHHITHVCESVRGRPVCKKFKRYKL